MKNLNRIGRLMLNGFAATLLAIGAASAEPQSMGGPNPPLTQNQHPRQPPQQACGNAPAKGRVCEHDGFAGRCIPLCDYGYSYIGDDFNDKISSIEIYAGTWTFFQDTDFAGAAMRLGPGSYPSVEQAGRTYGGGPGWNDTISSVREQ